MISITKIFHFETAHAIYNYPGACSQIHGHSYELHVCVKAKEAVDGYVDGMGIIMDFKDLKRCVQEKVIGRLDHQLVLSRDFLSSNKQPSNVETTVVFECEPTAENFLIFIREQIVSALPGNVSLHSLKLWETRDSYAEWSAD